MPQAIVTCTDCGQQNRLPLTIAPGKLVVCGRCKVVLDTVDDADDAVEEND